MKISFWKKMWTSMSFRINLIMILIMLVLGWTYSKSVTFWVNGVNNTSRCVAMTETINTSIEDRLTMLESVAKAGALVVRSHKLTPENSHVICDSIARMNNDIDSMYVVRRSCGVAEVDKCISAMLDSGTNAWSDPHWNSDSAIVVTFVTPLMDVKGKSIAALCTDVNLDWLRNLAESESHTDNTTVSVMVNDGRYIYHSDSCMLMKKDNASEDVALYDNEDSHFGMTISDGTVNGDGNATVSSKKVKIADWTLRCSVPFRDSSEISIMINVITILLLILLFIAMAMSLIVTINWQLRPLKKITKAAEAVSMGHFRVPLPKIKGHTEVRELRDSFERMQVELEKYIDDLKTSTEQNAALERDLQIAWNIQQGILPKTFPAFPERNDLDIYGFLRPAKEVGGDIFDFFMRDNKLFLLIGDVSGKGVPAALFMTVVGHLFRNLGRHTTDPVVIVRDINRGLAEGNEQNMFCTLIVGVLDMKTGLLNLCNAGHNAPIFVHRSAEKEDKDVSFVKTEVNVSAGVCDDYEYKSDLLNLHESDVLFLYTDGLTEAENRKHKLFGNDATLKAIREFSDGSMQELSDGVRSHVKKFIDGNEQSDDFTILCLRWR